VLTYDWTKNGGQVRTAPRPGTRGLSDLELRPRMKAKSPICTRQIGHCGFLMRNRLSDFQRISVACCDLTKCCSLRGLTVLLSATIEFRAYSNFQR